MSARSRTVVLQFFPAGMVAAGEIDPVGQDDEAWGATGKLGANDNEGLLAHSHAGARDAVGQQRERVSAIQRIRQHPHGPIVVAGKGFG
jgi:hypothetical protein